jgi:hypothetical protein
MSYIIRIRELDVIEIIEDIEIVAIDLINNRYIKLDKKCSTINLAVQKLEELNVVSEIIANLHEKKIDSLFA